MGAVCAFLSVVGFYASAYDVHGEEGMILGFQVVAPAIQLHLGMFWFLRSSWVSSLCANLKLWVPLASACAGVQ